MVHFTEVISCHTNRIIKFKMSYFLTRKLKLFCHVIIFNRKEKMQMLKGSTRENVPEQNVQQTPKRTDRNHDFPFKDKHHTKLKTTLLGFWYFKSNALKFNCTGFVTKMLSLAITKF